MPKILDITDFMQNFTLSNFKAFPYVLMGVLNITPDSFSDGGHFATTEKAIERAQQLLQEGAHILDIGGESTRQKAQPVSTQLELDRTIPVIEGIRKFSNIPISIDTTKAAVAQAALKAGANIINDISGATADPAMISLAAQAQCPIILMHMQGTPATMQDNPQYTNVVEEVSAFLKQQAEQLIKAGVKQDQILIDPGIGFGKTYEHNLILLKNISAIQSLGFKILLGVSRKSLFQTMIQADVKDRVIGTTAVNTYALSSGIRFFRVHDIKANRQALEVTHILLGK